MRELWSLTGEDLADRLAKAGLGRVNISLDSLAPETFRRITRTGDLHKVLAGLDAAVAAWGPRNIKLNTVLMRGVNDDAGTLVRLSEALFDGGVLPYYLHMLDKVRGAAHFGVDDAQAQAMMAQLRARLPGYLVPRLVRELPGADAKIPLAPGAKI